jgi:hypothetical protein
MHREIFHDPYRVVQKEHGGDPLMPFRLPIDSIRERVRRK